MERFSGTITDASIAIDQDQLEGGIDMLRGDDTAEFDAVLLDDGTWRTMEISWPDIDPDIGIPIADLSIDFDVDPIQGKLDRQENSMVARISATIGVEVTFSENSMIGSVNLEATPTTGRSGDLVGAASGFETESATATLVDNELTLPSTGHERIDQFVGLPTDEPGRNWVEFDAEFDLPPVD